MNLNLINKISIKNIEIRFLGKELNNWQLGSMANNKYTFVILNISKKEVEVISSSQTIIKLML